MNRVRRKSRGVPLLFPGDRKESASIQKRGNYFESAEGRDIGGNLFAINCYLQGKSCLTAGLFEKAVFCFTRAIESQSRFVNAYINRGFANGKLGNISRAISDYDMAISMDPHSDLTYYNRGNLHYLQGRFDEAIRDFSRAIENNPSSPPTYLNRGSAYLKKGEVDRAICDFNKMIEFEPRSQAAYYNRGIAYLKKSMQRQAFSDFNQASFLTAGEGMRNKNLLSDHGGDENPPGQNYYRLV